MKYMYFVYIKTPKRRHDRDERVLGTESLGISTRTVPESLYTIRTSFLFPRRRYPLGYATLSDVNFCQGRRIQFISGHHQNRTTRTHFESIFFYYEATRSCLKHSNVFSELTKKSSEPINHPRLLLYEVAQHSGRTGA
jgi:hypothetical protein